MKDRLSNWDEVQLRRLSDPPDDFADLTVEEAAELIRDWFLENFEDPANMTPYESREGGYQYIWGGPYDARDVVSDIFADVVSDEIIEAAVSEIESDGIWEWAPHNGRIEPPEDWDDRPSGSTAAILHAAMLARIEALEAALRERRTTEPGIGHNRPPGPIEEDGWTAAHDREIDDALQILKAQPPEPDNQPPEAVEAVSRLRTARQRIADYVMKQADNVVTNATSALGKTIGAGLALLLGDLAGLLDGVIEAASRWLSSLAAVF